MFTNSSGCESEALALYAPFPLWPCYHDTVRAACSECGCHGNRVANGISGSFRARWLLRVVCCCSPLVIVWSAWNSTWRCASFVVPSSVRLEREKSESERNTRKKKDARQCDSFTRKSYAKLVQRKTKLTVS